MEKQKADAEDTVTIYNEILKRQGDNVNRGYETSEDDSTQQVQVV